MKIPNVNISILYKIDDFSPSKKKITNTKTSLQNHDKTSLRKLLHKIMHHHYKQ